MKEETYKYVPSDAASEVDDAVKVLQNYDELSVTNQMMEQLEIEQKKISFFTDKLSNITFVYNANLDMIFFSKKDALRLNAPEVVLNPLSNKGIISEEHKKALEEFIELAKNTTCEKPDFEFECNLTIDGEEKICHCICRTMWLMKTKAEFAGVVGIINQERNVEDKQQVFSINGVNTKEEYYKMSFAQARTMVEELKKF